MPESATPVLDALDALSEARDLLELIRMAHRFRHPGEDRAETEAVMAGATAALAALERAAAHLAPVRGAAPTCSQAAAA